MLLYMLFTLFLPRHPTPHASYVCLYAVLRVRVRVPSCDFFVHFLTPHYMAIKNDDPFARAAGEKSGNHALLFSLFSWEIATDAGVYYGAYCSMRYYSLCMKKCMATIFFLSGAPFGYGYFQLHPVHFMRNFSKA